MDSELRGYNRCIKVSVLHKDGRPTLIGYIHLHSSTNCGYYAEVCHFLNTLMGYKLNTDGYDLLNKKVKIIGCSTGKSPDKGTFVPFHRKLFRNHREQWPSSYLFQY